MPEMDGIMLCKNKIECRYQPYSGDLAHGKINRSDKAEAR